MPVIRRLSSGEAGIYRSLRLMALAESPGCFLTSYESALARDESSWVAQAEASAEGSERATFIVLDERPIGLAALYREAEGSEVGDLLQMWVAPPYRGGAVAVDLLDHLFEWAGCHGFRLIRAEVTSGNGRALRFYEKYGFRAVALEGEECCLVKEVVEKAKGASGEGSALIF